MKSVSISSLAMGVCLLALSPGVALAGQANAGTITPTTGQPGTAAGFNCGTTTAPVTPGNAANAQSVFNEPFPVGTTSQFGGIAGQHYAGNTNPVTGSPTASLANAASTAASSQYDVACKNASQIH
jgi:hypothetical protein